MKKTKFLLLQLCISICLVLGACSSYDISSGNASADNEAIHQAQKDSSLKDSSSPQTYRVSLEDVPEFSNQPYVAINDNIPYFTDDDCTTKAFEDYTSLDSLGRCGAAYANICTEIMPTEKRDEIGQIKPSGWKTIKYDIVEGKYLYNRCHLIGFQLAGENANEKNLITGTRYMNVEGMLPFENMVADYVKETDNHVLYRVTPIYNGNELIARGVQMEAFSVEDDGDGICFNVFVYNNQPGITIDYATGDSRLSDNNFVAEKDTTEKNSENHGNRNENNSEADYILNTGNKKFHYPSCSSVSQMSDSNKAEFSGDRDDLISEGYSPCGRCNP